MEKIEGNKNSVNINKLYALNEDIYMLTKGKYEIWHNEGNIIK